MPLHSQHPRYITTIPDGLLVVIPVAGRRAITKTFRASLASPDELMTQAVAWRDRVWRRLFGGAVPERSFHSKAREGSSTNVPGVRYLQKAVRKGNRKYVVPCILAEVHTIPGVDYVRPRGSRSRVYSLNKYEWEEAIALAAAWRAAMVADLDGRRLDPRDTTAEHEEVVHALTATPIPAPT